jgi:ribosomal protein L40E
MTTDFHVPPGSSERLEADSVCVQCGTVNPEGTLLCKKCGNNLRDQRRIRLEAEEQLLGIDRSRQRREIIRTLLFILGALVVVLVALNVDTVANYLISLYQGGSTAMAAVDMFSSHPDAAVYDGLSQKLQDLAISSEVADEARDNPPLNPAWDGAYAIFYGLRYVGSAYAETRGDALYVVAKVGTATEIRARGSFQGLERSGVTADWENATARVGNTLLAVSGVVLRRQNGSVEGYGRTEDGREFNFLAYPVPTP